MSSPLWGKKKKRSKENAKWFLVCYTNGNRNVAEGDLCPSKSFRYLCKFSKGLCLCLCGGNLSHHGVKAESTLPLRGFKSFSSAALKHGHLKEQSARTRHMEAIWRPLENSQSSKGHIYIYFSGHRLEEYCTRATRCSHGKHQLARGTPGFFHGGICGQSKWHGFWEMLSTSGSHAASAPLPNLPTDLRRKKQHGLPPSSFTLCVKFTDDLHGLSGTALLPFSLHCCIVPLHLHSNL